MQYYMREAILLSSREQLDNDIPDQDNEVSGESDPCSVSNGDCPDANYANASQAATTVYESPTAVSIPAASNIDDTCAVGDDHKSSSESDPIISISENKQKHTKARV